MKPLQQASCIINYLRNESSNLSFDMKTHPSMALRLSKTLLPSCALKHVNALFKIKKHPF